MSTKNEEFLFLMKCEIYVWIFGKWWYIPDLYVLIAVALDRNNCYIYIVRAKHIITFEASTIFKSYFRLFHIIFHILWKQSLNSDDNQLHQYRKKKRTSTSHLHWTNWTQNRPRHVMLEIHFPVKARHKKCTMYLQSACGYIKKG